MEEEPRPVGPAAAPPELEELVASSLGRRPARIEHVPAGLGSRRFLRIGFEGGEPRTLIARLEADSPLRVTAVREPEPASTAAPIDPRAPTPPAWLPEPALEPTRSVLEAAGLPVPASALHRADLGLDLLEDLGPRTLLDLRGEPRAARYREACALIPRLQRIAPGPEPIPAFSRIYDHALVASKAWKWLHWTIPLLLGRPATREERAATHALFDHVATLAEVAPRRVAHRDYKAENLHLAPPRRAGEPERLVMIDVQGAFLAPPEYDLVCLLYDLQTDLPEVLVAELMESTRTALPEPPEPAVFAERFDALVIARLCKDVSHVVHAACHRGDRRRWHEIPRGLELIRRAAGRRGHTFPGLRALHSVTSALTQALETTDSAFELRRPGTEPE